MTTVAPFSAMTATRPQRSLWLITFVDLVMLLLAFFVLVFSMSSFDRPRYAQVVRSYAEVFKGLGVHKEVTVGPVRIPDVTRAPGDDLAYLEAVLRTTFAREQALDAIQFRLTSQYLILEVPAQVTDAGSVEVFDEQTQGRFFALGGALNNLSNRIAVVAPVATGVGPQAWASAMSRAAQARAALRSAGYDHDVGAFAQGSPAELMAKAELPPLQIMIFPETAKAGRAP